MSGNYFGDSDLLDDDFSKLPLPRSKSSYAYSFWAVSLSMKVDTVTGPTDKTGEVRNTDYFLNNNGQRICVDKFLC